MRGADGKGMAGMWGVERVGWGRGEEGGGDSITLGTLHLLLPLFPAPTPCPCPCPCIPLPTLPAPAPVSAPGLNLLKKLIHVDMPDTNPCLTPTHASNRILARLCFHMHSPRCIAVFSQSMGQVSPVACLC